MKSHPNDEDLFFSVNGETTNNISISKVFGSLKACHQGRAELRVYVSLWLGLPQKYMFRRFFSDTFSICRSIWVLKKIRVMGPTSTVHERFGKEEILQVSLFSINFPHFLWPKRRQNYAHHVRHLISYSGEQSSRYQQNIAILTPILTPGGWHGAQTLFWRVISRSFSLNSCSSQEKLTNVWHDVSCRILSFCSPQNWIFVFCKNNH